MQIKLTFDNGRVLVIDAAQEAVVEPTPRAPERPSDAVFGFVNIYEDANGHCDHPGYYVHTTEEDADERAESNQLRCVRVLKQSTAPAQFEQKWNVGTRRSGRLVIDNGRVRHPVRNIIGTLYKLAADRYVFVGA